jgi:hypothetical protein
MYFTTVLKTCTYHANVWTIGAFEWDYCGIDVQTHTFTLLPGNGIGNLSKAFQVNQFINVIPICESGMTRNSGLNDRRRSTKPFINLCPVCAAHCINMALSSRAEICEAVAEKVAVERSLLQNSCLRRHCQFIRSAGITPVQF